jgi:hypothetical protein
MRNERVRAAKLVAEHLGPAEADIDLAMGSLAALTTALLTARAEANLSPCVGQDAFNSVGEATALLFQARSKLVDAHHCLHQVQKEVGLRETSFGPSQLMGALAPAAVQSNIVAIAS